jgi:hypothetical protein
MSDSDAAMALASLDNWPTTRLRWQGLHSDLTSFLRELGHEVPPGLREPRATNYLILQSKAIESDELALSAIGLETRRWWTPANGLSLKLPIRVASDYPNTNRLFSSWLGLPFFLSMDVPNWKSKIAEFSNN